MSTVAFGPLRYAARPSRDDLVKYPTVPRLWKSTGPGSDLLKPSEFRRTFTPAGQRLVAWHSGRLASGLAVTGSHMPGPGLCFLPALCTAVSLLRP
eukprot:764058-Hanusia_phi.AAC.2